MYTILVLEEVRYIRTSVMISDILNSNIACHGLHTL